jgi:hypothetical protein
LPPASLRFLGERVAMMRPGRLVQASKAEVHYRSPVAARRFSRPTRSRCACKAAPCARPLGRSQRGAGPVLEIAAQSAVAADARVEVPEREEEIILSGDAASVRVYPAEEPAADERKLMPEGPRNASYSSA